MARQSIGVTILTFKPRTYILKRLIRLNILVAAAFLLLPCAVFSDTTVGVDAGYLRQNASTALPASTMAAPNSGALLLLIAAGGTSAASFDNTLAPGEYFAGGDELMAAFAFNINGGSSGTGGETRNAVDVPESFYTNYSSYVGNYVELCWFPNITYAQYLSGVTPTAGMPFGAYNPKAVNSSQSLMPDGGTNWVVPADGAQFVTLNLFTKDDQSGTQPVSAGYANFTVVPEPSALAMMGCALACLGILLGRSKSR